MEPRPFAARAALAAGVATFLAVLALVVVGPSLAAGPRVSATLDQAAIDAYYAHPALAWLGLAMLPVALGMVVFAVALRDVLATTPRGRLLATIGLAAVLVEAPLLLTQGVLQVVMVDFASRGNVPLPLFRFWDLLYNSAADAVEVFWVVPFSLAMRGVAGFPRWMPAYGLVAGALLLALVPGVLLGWPDAVHLLLYLPTMAWFVLTFVGLRRHVRAGAEVVARRGAPA